MQNEVEFSYFFYASRVVFLLLFRSHLGLDITFCKKKNFGFISNRCLKGMYCFILSFDIYDGTYINAVQELKKYGKRKNLQVTFLTQTAMSEKYLVYSFTMSIQMQYNTKHVLKTATQFIPKRCKKSSHMFVLDNLCSSLRRNKEKI